MDCTKIIILLASCLILHSQRVPFYNIATTKPVELKILNSPFRETNLSLTPDGKTMYFMSTRGGQQWSRITTTFKGKPQYDGDIWKSTRNNNKWQEPICLKPPVNTPEGEDEPIVINDSTLIYQSWRTAWQNSSGPYYKLIFHKGYVSITGLNSGISEFFNDSLSFYRRFATDGAYLTPDGKKFYFAANKDYDGKMDIYVSYLRNNEWTYPVKSNASTSGDERSIFITGKFIFFASDSYNSLGGYDIFVGEIEQTTGKITNIRNLGEPINSPEDEYSFVINPADSTEAFFVRNGNIFTIRLKKLSGIPPLQIFFAFDSDSIMTPKDSVNQIIKYCSSAKRIVLIGHTDTIGTAKYNVLLGFRRAKKVKKLLENSGISSDKIIVLSRGETEPTYYIDEKNRRVEVILYY